MMKNGKKYMTHDGCAIMLLLKRNLQKMSQTKQDDLLDVMSSAVITALAGET